MSLRMVRVVTPSRVASSVLVQSRRACNTDSRRSSRAEVSDILRILIRNLGTLLSAIIPRLLYVSTRASGQRPAAPAALTRQGEAHERRRHPALPHRDPSGRGRLPARQAPQGPLARRAARRGVDPRHTAGLPEEARRVLADAVRLARGRGAA